SRKVRSISNFSVACGSTGSNSKPASESSAARRGEADANSNPTSAEQSGMLWARRSGRSCILFVKNVRQFRLLKVARDDELTIADRILIRGDNRTRYLRSGPGRHSRVTLFSRSHACADGEPREIAIVGHAGFLIVHQIGHLSGLPVKNHSDLWGSFDAHFVTFELDSHIRSRAGSFDLLHHRQVSSSTTEERNG